MKKLLLFLFCGILIFTLVGCNQNKNTSPNDVLDEATNSKIEEVAGETTIPTNNENYDKDNVDNTEITENESTDKTTDETTDNIINEKVEEKPAKTEKPKEENKIETEKVEKPIEPTEPINKDTAKEPENTEPVVTPATDHTPTTIELEVLELMNKERAEEGLSALTYNATIYDCGVIRANECLIKWSHTRPNGTQYWTVFEECDKKITTCCGENLAKTFTSAEQIVEVLMNSEGHRKNILYKDFTSVCITILKDNEGYYYMSQLFMGK